MKLKELFPPTPKCPRCEKHTIKRISVMHNLVYDCPECQAVYEEVGGVK